MLASGSARELVVVAVNPQEPLGLALEQAGVVVAEIPIDDSDRLSAAGGDYGGTFHLPADRPFCQMARSPATDCWLGALPL